IQSRPALRGCGLLGRVGDFGAAKGAEFPARFREAVAFWAAGFERFLAVRAKMVFGPDRLGAAGAFVGQALLGSGWSRGGCGRSGSGGLSGRGYGNRKRS